MYKFLLRIALVLQYFRYKLFYILILKLQNFSKNKLVAANLNNFVGLHFVTLLVVGPQFSGRVRV